MESGTGQGIHSGVWDGWRGTSESLRRVGRSFERSWTGRETLSDVRDRLGDLLGGPGRVGDPPGGPELVLGHLGRYEMGWGTV